MKKLFKFLKVLFIFLMSVNFSYATDVTQIDNGLAVIAPTNGNAGFVIKSKAGAVVFQVDADGTLSVAGGLATNASGLTLDDGSGNSPSLVLQDGTNETATFTKLDADYLDLTTSAGDGFNLLTGNLKVGNGSPNTTLDGEDAYVEGAFEVDGSVRFDGGLSFNGAIVTTVTLDDGTGASPSFVFQDGTDETATWSKVDAGFLTVTTSAGDGVNVLTGNLKVGNGTPGVAQDGEDAYVEGTLEVDGAVQLDGTVSVAGEVVFGAAANVAFAKQDVTTTAATLNLTPASTYVKLGCNRAGAADTAVTLIETGAVTGQILYITVDDQANNAGTCSFADSAGVQLTTGATLDDADSITFIHDGFEWVQISTSNN